MATQVPRRGTAWSPPLDPRRTVSGASLVAILSALAARVLAEPVAAPTGETSGIASAGAPVAGQESGRIDAGDGGDSMLRAGLRAALLAPRAVVNLVLSPVRLGMWAYDRYHLDELYYRVFFNDARTL